MEAVLRNRSINIKQVLLRLCSDVYHHVNDKERMEVAVARQFVKKARPTTVIHVIMLHGFPLQP